MSAEETPGSRHERSDGDILGELDRLWAEYRESPRPELEGRLLELRHLAAKQLEGTRSRPLSKALDPFPEDVVLPEVARESLDAATIARAIHHRGALVVRGLLDATQIETLRDDLDGLIAAQTAQGDGTQMLGGVGNRMVTESPTATAHIFDIWERSGLLLAVREYLGSRPVCISERVRLRRDRKGLPWHQDAAFFGGRLGAINTWVALVPCGEDRDGLAVVPRRVNEVVGLTEGERAAFNYGNGTFTAERIAELCGGSQVVAPVFAAGDALLFDEMTVHRTHVVRNAVGTRDVAVTWFFAPDRFPKRDFPAPWTQVVA